jgi:hypothetical protein
LPIVGRQEQVAVDASEIAGDGLFVADAFDAIDGCAVALGRKPAPFFAMNLLDLDEAIIDGVRQVR